MSRHPSLQPRLDRSNVATIVSYLKAERDECRAGARTFAPHSAAAYLKGKADGLDRAVEIVADMWASAVIVTDALADDLAAALDDMADDIGSLDDEGVEDDD